MSEFTHTTIFTTLVDVCKRSQVTHTTFITFSMSDTFLEMKGNAFKYLNYMKTLNITTFDGDVYENKTSSLCL